MSAANVFSIQALEDLKAALARFVSDGQEALSAAAQEIHRTLDWLAERQNHWQVEVRRRQEIVAQARAVLARCQASGFRDREGHYHPPDCSRQERALLEVQRHLAEAEAELRNVQQWIQKVQQAVGEYRREAQRLSAVLGTDMSKASALLGNSVSILHSYAAMSAPSSGMNATISGSTVSSTPSTITWSEQRGILQRVDAGQPITLDELDRLQQVATDLQYETRAEDESWIQQILESERYHEAMRGSKEIKLDVQDPSEALRHALLSLLKAINYWRSKP